ncbi:MAG: GNAT family N-acetyltransferase [Bacteroidia bacterium]
MLNINFTTFPSLITNRLLLRQLKTEDENEIFALRTNETVNKFIDRPKTNSSAYALKFIERITNGIANNESIYWAIALKNNFKLTGTICLWNISQEHFRAEIGYELHPDFHGKGIMQEAFTKVVEYGFHTMKLKTIVAFTNALNERSRKLLEKNNFRVDANFEYLKTEKEKINRTVIYSLMNS